MPPREHRPVRCRRHSESHGVHGPRRAAQALGGGNGRHHAQYVRACICTRHTVFILGIAVRHTVFVLVYDIWHSYWALMCGVRYSFQALLYGIRFLYWILMYGIRYSHLALMYGFHIAGLHKSNPILFSRQGNTLQLGILYSIVPTR